MGILNFNLSDLYSKAKNLVSDLYGGVKVGTNLLKQGKDYLSEQLDKLSALPYVGGLIKEATNKLGNAPLPFLDGLSISDIGRGIDYANEYVNSPTLREAAGRFDQIASGAARSADQFLSSRAG